MIETSSTYPQTVLLIQIESLHYQYKKEDHNLLIDHNIQKIIDLCKKHKVHKLFVFGSILTNRYNDKSDVDLVVDFNKKEVEDYFDNYFDFKYSLEELLGREIDLLEEQTIKNPYLKKNVDATKTLIYG